VSRIRRQRWWRSAGRGIFLYSQPGNEATRPAGSAYLSAQLPLAQTSGVCALHTQQILYHWAGRAAIDHHALDDLCRCRLAGEAQMPAAGGRSSGRTQSAAGRLIMAWVRTVWPISLASVAEAALRSRRRARLKRWWAGLGKSVTAALNSALRVAVTTVRRRLSIPGHQCRNRRRTEADDRGRRSAGNRW
jgi:hypothetical protein